MSEFFSIIIPAFNSASTLPDALNSVLVQRFRDFEVLLMDGFSNDETLQIAQSFNDSRIRIFSEKDQGTYDAMNKGIATARGEWIYFLGSDDRLFDEHVLEDVHQKLITTKLSVAYGNVQIKGEVDWAKGGAVYDGAFSLYKLLRRNICHQSIFYRNSFLKKNQLNYHLHYPVSADWEFNLRCRMLTGFLFLDRIIAVFNGGGLSSSEKNTDAFRDEIPVIYQKYWEVPYTNPLVRLVYKGYRLFLKR